MRFYEVFEDDNDDPNRVAAKLAGISDDILKELNNSKAELDRRIELSSRKSRRSTLIPNLLTENAGAGKRWQHIYNEMDGLGIGNILAEIEEHVNNLKAFPNIVKQNNPVNTTS